jgi:tetratricopeptide (TPR) repeat protein
LALDREKTLESAQKYQAKGQYDKAISEYQKLVKETPNDVRTWLKIGDLYKRLNSKKEAVDTYMRVVASYVQQGDFLKTVAVCKEVLKLDTAHIEAQHRLALAYEKLALVSEAIATYEQLAAVYLRQNDTEKVLDTLSRMVNIDTMSIPVRIKYAEALSKYGKLEEAAAEFEWGCTLLREQGRMDDFLKVAERLLFHRPEDAAIAKELALLYLERNDGKRALSKLQVCFKANPKDVETLDLLSQAFANLGQNAKTVSVLREILRIHAESGDKAARALIAKRILEIDPQDAEARQALAQNAPAAKGAGAPPAPPPQKPKAAPPALPSLDDDDEDVLAPSTIPPSSNSMPPVELDGDLEDLEEVSVPDGVLQTSSEVEVPLRGEPSIPPEVMQEAQIARLLTEIDVFQRYGLKNKVIEHLVAVLTIAPDHFEARDRLKSAYLDSGYVQEAVEELIILAELANENDPKRAADYLREILVNDPENADAAARLAELEPGESFGDSTDASSPRVSLPPSATTSQPAPRLPSVPPADDPNDDIDRLAPMSPAEFDAAPLRRTIPPPPKSKLSPVAANLESSLDEADFYVAQGLFSQARGIVESLSKKHVDHPLVAEKLAEIDELEKQAQESLPPRHESTDDSFYLAEKLAEELGPDAGGPEIGSDILDVDQVFAKFKKGVAEQVGLEDSDTHYDLGIAYKEMGLLDDAVHEFQLAMSNPQRECVAHTMIGLCYMEKSAVAEAISHFKKGLYCETKSEREELGLYFELANAYEMLQDPKEALYYFQKVQKRDPSFRSVGERLQALRDASSAVRAELSENDSADIELSLDDEE